MSKVVRLLLLVAIFTSTFMLVSCASTPKNASGDNFSGNGTDIQVKPVSLMVNTDRSFFASIDKEIMTLVQDGSPYSLRQAASMLHKSDVTQYTNAEVVLLNIISEISLIVWPSVPLRMEVPELRESNPYMGAIESSKKGIFDTSTGNSDFYSTLLPAFVVFSPVAKAESYDRAVDVVKKALEIQKTSIIANYLMGYIYQKKGEYAKSLEYFAYVSRETDSVFEVNNAIAVSYYGSGQYEKALAASESILASRSQDTALLKICAESCFKLADLERAEDYVLRVLQLEPANIDYVLFRSEILITKGDYVRASSLLDAYGRSNPTGRKYLLLRAQMQKNWNKNNNSAAETLSQALKLYPNDKEILLFAAEFCSANDMDINRKSAIDYANAYLEIDSHNLRALTVCVDELIKKGDWLSAYSVCQPLMGRNDITNELVYDYIDICLHLNKSSEAWSRISSLYESNPGDEVTQQMYIQVLIATKRTTQALALINELLPSANSKMKSFLYYQKSFLEKNEEAILGDLRSSLTANPRNTDVLYRMYQIYYGRQDWKRAQYYLKQVVALEPKNQDILNKNEELDALLGK